MAAASPDAHQPYAVISHLFPPEDLCIGDIVEAYGTASFFYKGSKPDACIDFI
jgi:hypothetical protein